MNTERQYNGSFRGPGEDMLSPKRPPHTKRKAPNPMLLRVLRAAILGACGMILLLALVVSILPMFRIQTVESEGNSYYTTEQLMQAAGIKKGNEIFGLDLDHALQSIFEGCPYVEKCSVGITSPVSVKISVSEKTDVMYTKLDGKYVSMEYNAKDASMRVLEVREDEEALLPFLSVSLPEIESAVVGNRILFADDDDIAYVQALTDALEEHKVLARVRHLDAEDVTRLAYTLEDGRTVKLGTLDQLDEKIELAEQMLANPENADGVTFNVSNPDKPTVATE